MSTASGDTHGRLAAIEHLKGVAILLVVAAHLVKYQTLGAAAWYELFKYKVYLFHMPLFMFASGYVYFHTGAHRIPLTSLRPYALRRADRLLVPFFALGLIMVTGKLLVSGYAYVDEAPESMAQAYARMALDTEDSPVLTIWYLYVLFVFSIATPLLYRLAGRRLVLLALVAACLYPLPIPDILFANRIGEFYLFFIAGGIAQSLRMLDRPPGRAWPLLPAVAFALVLMLPLGRGHGLLLCGLVAAWAIPALLHGAPRKLLAILHFFGCHSMSIYLFNVIAIGVAKAGFLRLFPYDPTLFVPLLCVCFCAGIGMPLLLVWASGLTRHTALVHRYIR